MLSRKYSIAIILFLVAIIWVYFYRIIPASKAISLLKHGETTRGKVRGVCVPIPIKMDGYFIFFLNNEKYTGNLGSHKGVFVGDTIDVLYAPEDPTINMAAFEAKDRSLSMWSMLVFNKKN